MSNKSPTVFTDEDLKFCKDGGAKLRLVLSDRYKVMALFRRLEAAEMVCKEMKNSYIPDAFTDSLMQARSLVPAWLRAAGKQ